MSLTCIELCLQIRWALEQLERAGQFNIELRRLAIALSTEKHYPSGDFEFLASCSQVRGLHPPIQLVPWQTAYGGSSGLHQVATRRSVRL